MNLKRGAVKAATRGTSVEFSVESFPPVENA